MIDNYDQQRIKYCAVHDTLSVIPKVKCVARNKKCVMAFGTVLMVNYYKKKKLKNFLIVILIRFTNIIQIFKKFTV